jgi:uncharacterized protein YjiS (DUF1127 family)
MRAKVGLLAACRSGIRFHLAEHRDAHRAMPALASAVNGQDNKRKHRSMELHSRQSLYEVHGISARDKARLQVLWTTGIFAVLTRVKSALRAEVQARRAASELAGLDDRMLRDIGVSRSDIERAVRRR